MMPKKGGAVRINSKLKACVLAVALTGVPFATHAASLGKLNVLSGLGQPLRAEIDLVSVQPSEADSLKVTLAPADAYRDAQIDYPSSTLGLRFNLEKRSNGSYFVVMTSNQSVNEPFLDLLLELRWNSGRVVREYSALLDPVGYAPAKAVASSASATQSKTVTPQAVVSAPPANTAQTPKSSEPAKAAAQPKVEPKAEGETHVVKTGESLAGIASHYTDASLSLEQVLVGIYRANTGAFEGQNMNRLRKGKTLNIPSNDQLKAIPRADAAKEVKLQAADWTAYRSKLAEAAGASTKEAEKDAGSGKITAKVEDKGVKAAQPTQDVLKLSKGETSKDGKALKDKIQSLEEEALAREKAIKEANTRVVDLEKQIKDMQKLLELKSKAAADLQKQAADAQKASQQAASAKVPAAATKPVEPAKAEPAKVEPPKVATVAPVAPVAKVDEKPAEPAKVEPVKADEKAETPAVPPVAAEVDQPAPKKKPKIVLPPPEPEEPSMMEDPLVLGGIGALLLGAIGGGVAFALRRKKKPTFEDSIITGSDLKSNTVLGNTGGAVISTGATENSFLTDFSREGLGNIDTDEVDPVAEAEVYMAYGRDAQAEEILKDALAKDGNRQEVRLKLLEIYAARKNVTAFEATATEMYEAVSGAGPLWEQAAEMGRALDSANPLYAKPAGGNAAMDKTVVLGASAPAASALASDSFLADEAEKTHSDLEAIASIEEAPLEEAAASLDFDLGFDEPAQASSAPALVEAAVEDAAGLDFDLGDFGNGDASDSSASPSVTVEANSDVAPVETDMLSLDIPLDMNFDAPAVDTATGAAAVQSIVEEPAGLDIALDMPLSEVVEAAELPQEAALDFNFDMDEGALSASAVDATSPVDLSSIDLSLDSPVAEASLDDFGSDFGAEEMDPVSTKLDLAKAYIDMGDKEGAREILQEAMDEGTSDQKKIAEGLIAQL